MGADTNIQGDIHPYPSTTARPICPHMSTHTLHVMGVHVVVDDEVLSKLVVPIATTGVQSCPTSSTLVGGHMTVMWHEHEAVILHIPLTEASTSGPISLCLALQLYLDTRWWNMKMRFFLAASMMELKLQSCDWMKQGDNSDTEHMSRITYSKYILVFTKE